jgi:hypothetical protein
MDEIAPEYDVVVLGTGVYILPIAPQSSKLVCVMSSPTWAR